MKNTAIRRVFSVLIFFVTLFGAIVLRIYSIQHSQYSAAADMQFSREITLEKTRGNIYDINMSRLVNEISEKQYIVMSDESNNYLTEFGSADEIKKGLFIRMDSDENIKENKFIRSFKRITRYSDNLMCPHIIGYINSSGHGVAGIEKAFDKILSDASGRLAVSYNADATDNIIIGDGIEIVSYNYNSPAGIRLTIDKDIQTIVQTAVGNSVIERGAVVVLDTKTAEIRAMYSVPCYSADNIEASLSDKNLPFLNRALCSYPVGSVFKPIISAAALENGFSVAKSYECKGNIRIGDNTFSCFNNNEHGRLDLNRAVEKSCNTFFIDMGLETGIKKISEISKLFGFGKRIELCSTLVCEAGNLPESESITSDSDLANLCFGQGALLATPLQLAAAYNVLANKGIYTEPYILKELIDNEGKGYAYYKSEDSHYAISENYAEIINNCLYNNMLNGTGIKGKPDNVSSAGKTATAQTGRFNDMGEEILCTWFAGFFPFENPSYTVVIFNEEGKSAAEDCAPVFKEIAEKITEIKIQPSR